MLATNDYRKFLKEKLEERQQLNSRYSLRAYARDLRISFSRLSQVLRHKQGLSEKSAIAIAKQLKLSQAEADHFCTLVLSADARSKQQRRAALAKLQNLYSENQPATQLQLEAFRV